MKLCSVWYLLQRQITKPGIYNSFPSSQQTAGYNTLATTNDNTSAASFCRWQESWASSRKRGRPKEKKGRLCFVTCPNYYPGVHHTYEFAPPQCVPHRYSLTEDGGLDLQKSVTVFPWSSKFFSSRQFLWLQSLKAFIRLLYSDSCPFLIHDTIAKKIKVLPFCC